MALLGQILAALTQLNDEIAIGENGRGLSLSQSLSSSLTVQKPKALEVTKLGWPLRKDMDRKPSPRVKSVKGLSNLERHKGGEGVAAAAAVERKGEGGHADGDLVNRGLSKSSSIWGALSLTSCTIYCDDEK